MVFIKTPNVYSTQYKVSIPIILWSVARRIQPKGTLELPGWWGYNKDTQPLKHTLDSIQTRWWLEQVSDDILNASKQKNEVATQPPTNWTHPRHMTMLHHTPSTNSSIPHNSDLYTPSQHIILYNKLYQAIKRQQRCTNNQRRPPSVA
jgi:hypothetical protein